MLNHGARMRCFSPAVCCVFKNAGEKVFDSDDGGGSGGDDDEDGGGDDVTYDKFGNVIDKAAAERAALQELREAARAARAAKVRRETERQGGERAARPTEREKGIIADKKADDDRQTDRQRASPRTGRRTETEKDGERRIKET